MSSDLMLRSHLPSWRHAGGVNRRASSHYMIQISPFSKSTFPCSGSIHFALFPTPDDIKPVHRDDLQRGSTLYREKTRSTIKKDLPSALETAVYSTTTSSKGDGFTTTEVDLLSKLNVLYSVHQHASLVVSNRGSCTHHFT